MFGISFHGVLHETRAKKCNRHLQIRTRNGNFISLMRKCALSTERELIVFRILGVKRTFAFKSIYDQLLFFHAAAGSRRFLQVANFLKMLALENRNRTKGSSYCALTFRINKSTPFSLKHNQLSDSF